MEIKIPYSTPIVTTSISNSTFSGNTDNGGISVSNTTQDYTLNIIQSTVSGNTATANGGGIYIGDRGAAAAVNIKHSTIANNTAVDGGGIFNTATGADINLSHTVVAGNTASSAITTDEDIGVTAAGNVVTTFSFIGVNDINVTDAVGGSILNGGDPMLAALADGGNGTQVHALTADSVLLIDSGDPALTAGTGDTPTTDQAGNPRIATARIDIGAVEYTPAAPEPEPDQNLKQKRQTLTPTF